MKKLLLIFLVLLSFASYGQRIQKANTYGLAFNRTGGDTLFYLPNDTFTVPAAYLTYPFMARKGANVYIWNTSSNVWQGLTGGTLDTTGAFVTSVYRKTASDSVFYVKGGTHTFAFKDSTGGGTPTFQQVLTAGSTLTQNNTIEGGTYNLKFNANNIWDVDSASQWRLRSFRAADSSMQLISSSPSFASSIKRLTMQSQDSQYKSWNIIDYDHITNEVYTRPGAEFLQSGNYLYENGFSIIKYDGSESNNSLNSFDLIGDSSRTAKRISYTSNINGTLTDYSLTTKKYVDSVAALGGGSYTFTNGLTESGGTVKLGGALTQNTTITNASNYDYRLSLSEDGDNVGFIGTTYSSLLGFENGSGWLRMGSTTYSGVQVVSTSGNLLSVNTGTTRGSNVEVKPDEILINPSVGLLKIDTLTSAVGTKALRYNPTTGLVSYADTTSGGADGYVDNATFNTTTNYLTLEQTNAADVSVRIPPSYIVNPINADSLTRIVNDSTLMVKAVVIADTDPVEVTTVRNDSLNTHTIAIRQTFLDSIRNGDFGGGSPAGNYGNLQLNRNGAFATPASDSLSYNSAKLTVKGKLQSTDTLTTTHARVAGMDVGVYGGAVGFQNDAANTGKTGMYFRTFSGGSTNGPIVFESGSFKAQMIVSDAAQNQFQVVYGGNTGYINVGSHMNVYASGSQELRLGAGGTLNLVTLLGSGRMGVGVTAPTGMIHLKAGTASASTAPLKFTSGTNLTTAEAGAMEYNGTNLFFTPSSAARNNILMTASVNSVSPTAPDRTITVVIDGTTYYIHAKTTND